jgi:MFS family permease
MSAMRHRNFRLFFVGQLISMTGTWMQQVALSWLAYRLTGSAVLLGTVAFVGQLPVTVFSTVGGTIADRYDRRKILYYTQFASMLLAMALGALTLTHSIQIWHLFLFSILLGLCNAFDIPARQTFVSDMVDKEDLLNAIALNASVFHGSRVIGPAIAGLLVAGVGEGWCFLLNGFSFVAVLAGLALMRLNIVIHPRTGSAWQSMLEGLRYVWREREIRHLMMLVAVVSFFAMPYIVLMPIVADQVLHGGAKGMGILMGLSGAGSVVGALVLASKKRAPQTVRRIIGLAAMGFGLSLVAFSFARSFWIAGALLVPAGFCMVSQMATSNTRVQSMVPDRLRGRVMSVFGLMFMGIMPFGALLAGHVATWVGAPLTICGGGLVAVLAGLVFLQI